MKSPKERLAGIRTQRSEIENHLIDELRAQRLDRRGFITHAARLGMGIPLAGFIATACAERDSLETADEPNTAAPQQGGTLRVGGQTPSGALNPLLVGDQGGLTVLGQTGEYLAWSDGELALQPRLAEKWTPNEDGSVWTFKIRQGVTFHDGRALTARDVTATFDRMANPETGGNALSALTGVISPGSAVATDDYTVEFNLEAPNGNFPYLTSSDNYNAIIIPADDDPAEWPSTFIGTGPWKLDQSRPDEGFTLVRNPDYWGKQPVAEKIDYTFYGSEQAQILALQGNEVDVLVQFSVSGGKALLTNPDVVTTELRSSAHRQVHMRTDTDQFADKRVRRAMALLLNRTALVNGLLDTKCEVGNDSPFAPVFPSTAEGVAQREQNIDEAKKLLDAAGMADGFSVTLETWTNFEMPDYAQLIQDNARAAGIRVNLSITDAGTYYGDAVYGNSRWLDSTMGITEYGHRGVPNVFLGAPLTSEGTWNGAHFRSEEYDGLVRDYVAALEPEAQTTNAKKIQELLLDESPILFSYFYFFLSGAGSYVSGVETTAMGHADVSRAGIL